MADVTRTTIVEWAKAAKAWAENADIEVPRDEILLRSTVAFHQLTRGPHPSMVLAGDEVLSEDFRRSAAIVGIAIGFDDDPPSTPERLVLFAVRLEGDAEVSRG